MAMTGSMGRLAEGDHGVDIPGTQRGDELGVMAKAVLVFKENMIKAKELAAREAEAQVQREARARTIDTSSDEHTSELQSHMRISYAVFCLKQNTRIKNDANRHINTI